MHRLPIGILDSEFRVCLEPIPDDYRASANRRRRP